MRRPAPRVVVDCLLCAASLVAARQRGVSRRASRRCALPPLGSKRLLARERRRQNVARNKPNGSSESIKLGGACAIVQVDNGAPFCGACRPERDANVASCACASLSGAASARGGECCHFRLQPPPARKVACLRSRGAN